MHIAILSANLGSIERRNFEHVAQDLPEGVTVEFQHYDDTNCPQRPLALSTRLHAKKYKMLGWEYAPKADLIMWLDGAYQISHRWFVSWMLEHLGDAELCCMPHIDRTSIKAESDFMAIGMAQGNQYLVSRYKDEPFEEQVAHYLKDPTFKDDTLSATGCYVYRPTDRMKAMMKDWFIECVIRSYQDQLSFTPMLHRYGIKPNWLDCGVFDCPYLTYWHHAR